MSEARGVLPAYVLVADDVSGATDSHLGAVHACRAAMERMLRLLSQGAPMEFDSVAHHAAGDPLGDGDGRVGALFARHLAVPPTPLRLAHVLDFSHETFDDDRTLVAVWPNSSAGTP